ncbi:MAG TPA: bifunctional transaldolase/phosoglucose isomerase [Pyrinomonadaceae bacterium]|jgi:transaldolase/glucose-6-phosphate isomerase|nr:bifunctional transaldolase/phosoglucose isomerase [Pyrinomonadaceae bacterium]
MTNRLVEIMKLGQSIWYDNIRRAMLTSGDLKTKIEEDDLRGVTSNPTIFEKAITGSTDYDEQLRQLVQAGKSVGDIYEDLVAQDIGNAADILRPVYDKTDGVDGYISLEVNPGLAYKTQETIEEATRLFERLGRKNVMIKIPAAQEGLPAIEECIYRGININVTMIFSIENYEQVAEAFIKGLERRAAEGQAVDHIASVASFFVSRVDTAVDKDLEYKARHTESGEEKARLEGMLGKAAVANAKLAYLKFKEIFHGPRFADLKAKGAQVQRCLWASTGTKNPNYSDVLYVDNLIGPETVNTVPPATYTAIRDHGRVALTLEEGIEDCRALFDQLRDVGIDIKAVTEKLQKDGLDAFVTSFDTLAESIESKRDAILSGINERLTASLGKYADAVSAAIKEAEKGDVMRRVWRKDAALWKQDEAHQKIIKNALGWLTVPDMMIGVEDDLMAFADRIRGVREFKHVMVCGMGGSSLCPEVLRQTFGHQEGYPELLVLDSTDPDAFSDIADQIDITHCLFIISSKSGTTTEPLVFYKYWYDQVSRRKENPGECFVAVTDPGTKMEADATGDHFKRIFLNPADIGGRYSALSYFGMVPAALSGIDFRKLLDRAERIVHSCASVVPATENPGAKLGAVLGECAKAGRDKCTIVCDPKIASFGLWVEQLLAESTGKEGKGIVPIAGETLGSPSVYGDDRLFVSIAVERLDSEAESKLKALEAAGHPVVYRTLTDIYDLGEEFFLWEIATAFAGWRIGINPFDQPNVQESKHATKELLEAFTREGKLQEQPVVATDGTLTIYADDQTVNALSASSVGDAIKAHLARVKPGDYIAMLDYIEETPEHEAEIQAIRTHLRDATRCATTTGYGPRFLHSTGQLHKGGPATGVFLQVTAPDKKDLPIPGAAYTFNTLKQAQALGDFRSLSTRGRRAIRVDLGADALAGLKLLHKYIGEALPVSGATGAK